MAGLTCDVLVVGGSLGGVAAALRAGAWGAKVLLLEASGWLGGQMTAQGVCTPDENNYIETVGCTDAYQDFRRRVREHYRTHYKLTAQAKALSALNVGECWVNLGFSVEPLVGSRILAKMLAEVPNVTLLALTAQSVTVAGDQVTGITALAADGTVTQIAATFVLDATELGDLLPLAGAEWVIGAESRADTGEPDALPEAKPEWVQPLTVPFALERRPVGENHTIMKPPNYAALKASQKYTLVDGSITHAFVGAYPWWTYRRVIAAGLFQDPDFLHDIATINVGANDYKGGVIPTGDPDQDARILADARQASLGYLYWLQTECPRDDDPTKRGYPELKLRADLFGTSDGLSPAAYVRESRRIRAQRTIREQDLAAASHPGPRAALMTDSCGIGHYMMDVHGNPFTGEPEWSTPTKPFQIALGALVPVRLQNLLPACKNLGVTHLTNGAYRLHPIEWNVGEAAGALAFYCNGAGVTPVAVLEDVSLLRTFQKMLAQAGVPLFWWSDLPFGHPAFVAAHLLGAAGLFTGNGTDLRFEPDALLVQESQSALSEELNLTAVWPAGDLPRGEAAIWLVQQLKW